MLFLALDLGGSHATCALVSGSSLVCSRHLPFGSTARFEPVLPEITHTLQELVAQAADPVEGIGVGFCGLVDAANNRVHSTNGKFEDGLTFDFPRWARESFDLPLRLENDARLALRGEMFAGAARGVSDLVMFTLGTGIGGVAAMAGRPLTGIHGQAGVLAGHVPVRAKGRPCTCGGRGCAEAEASGWALPSICREWPGFSSSALAGRELNFKSLFSAAAEGDPIATAIRDHCLEIWGMMAVAAVHAFDPELVLFGGGAMGAADQILPALQTYVDQNAWTPWGKVRVAPAALGSDAALLGVPTLFREDW
ncbi:MAG TPA: ROK family protein [Acidobacteriaceae bacterium]|jgi:glucokinase|nr:ROK family protein [Acidobacteriaceae bacterium]